MSAQNPTLTVRGKDHFVRHMHTLRQFFRTNCSLSGMNGDVVEYCMDHRSSLAQVYFIGDPKRVPESVLVRMEGEYRK